MTALITLILAVAALFLFKDIIRGYFGITTLIELKQQEIILLQKLAAEKGIDTSTVIISNGSDKKELPLSEWLRFKTLDPKNKKYKVIG